MTLRLLILKIREIEKKKYLIMIILTSILLLKNLIDKQQKTLLQY